MPTLILGRTKAADGLVYFNPKSKLNYNDAQAFCASLNGTLPVISNKVSRDALWKLKGENMERLRTWIGTTDTQIEGQFMDVFGKRTTYLPWESGQGGFDHQDCVIMRDQDGLYNDVGCDELHSFVCQGKVTTAASISFIST